MLGLSLVQIVLIFGITFVGAILQSAIGFGLGPFAVPLLVLIDARLVPGSLLVAAVTLTILMYLRDCRGRVIFYHFGRFKSYQVFAKGRTFPPTFCQKTTKGHHKDFHKVKTIELITCHSYDNFLP